MFSTISVTVIGCLLECIAIVSLHTTQHRRSELNRYFASTQISLIKRPEDKIANGQPAEEGEIPWQVAVLFSTSFCGGSIVNSRWVLTAAHCCQYGNPSDYLVIAGTTEYENPGPNGRLFMVIEIIPHELYNPRKYPYDVGLLKVIEPLTFNYYIQPIPLLKPIEDDISAEVDNDCKTSGWGQTESGHQSDHLQVTEVTMIRTRRCNESYNGDVTIDMICNNGIKDACVGDSGGPLMCQFGGIWKLVGSTSWGRGCGEGYPGVFARTSFFYDWIMTKIAL